MTHRMPKPHRRWNGVVLSVALLATLTLVTFVVTRWVVETNLTPPMSTPWGPECSVWAEDEQVPLEREQAEQDPEDRVRHGPGEAEVLARAHGRTLPQEGSDAGVS